MILELIILGFLIIISLIDLKWKSVPSLFTTGAIIILLVVNMNNLYFGILATIFAIFLIEADVIRGLADLKVMAILGLMISNLSAMFLAMVLVLLIGIIYQFLMIKLFKQKEETAFLPVFLTTYIILLLSNLL